MERRAARASETNRTVHARSTKPKSPVVRLRIKETIVPMENAMPARATVRLLLTTTARASTEESTTLATKSGPMRSMPW